MGTYVTRDCLTIRFDSGHPTRVENAPHAIRRLKEGQKPTLRTYTEHREDVLELTWPDKHWTMIRFREGWFGGRKAISVEVRPAQVHIPSCEVRA